MKAIGVFPKEKQVRLIDHPALHCLRDGRAHDERGGEDAEREEGKR